MMGYYDDVITKNPEILGELHASNRTHWVDVCQRMSEMSDRFASRTFASFDTSEHTAAYLQAKTCAQELRGLYLWGPVGVGKTHLLAAIVNDCIERGIPSIFTTGVGLLMRIRKSYNRNGDVKHGEFDIIERMANVDVLALDDLGKEPFTQDTARLFYALINGRYEANKPLYVSSNLSLADLGLAWVNSGVEHTTGIALADRIREMCGTFVTMTGESKRTVQR